MKNFVMIFFALMLLLATLEADGKGLILEKERELILRGHSSTHKLGRKADIGAKDDKDPTANKGAATGRSAEDNSAVGLVDSQEINNLTDQLTSHHYYRIGKNPYSLHQSNP
ncbi:hypothetical protein CRYUN_Cryun40dG0005800 [Craigia yunnanensis]